MEYSGRVAIAGIIFALIAAWNSWGSSRFSAQAGPQREVQAQLAGPPAVPPQVRRKPGKVVVALETMEVRMTLADGVEYVAWTFGGTVPGPMIRVRIGDEVQLTLRNSKISRQIHSIDLYAVNGPGGGATLTQTAPGKETAFRWKVLNPGLYVYHCASPHIPTHIANGMYGLILVEPAGGLSKVDREYYVMQGEFYTKDAFGAKGLQAYDIEKGKLAQPEYVVFNGKVGALVGTTALMAKAGETVRIFFGNSGPNLVSSFHIIGEIFDRVYPEGAVGSAPNANVQTTLVPAGGATIVEFKVDVPGTYLLVDHSIFRIDRGAVGILLVGGQGAKGTFESITPGAPGRH